MRIRVDMFQLVGDFGEDKDRAALMREQLLKDQVCNKCETEINFDRVTLVTQSFIHALISDLLRTHGEEALEYLFFTNCVDGVKGIISTVVQYSLDSADM